MDMIVKYSKLNGEVLAQPSKSDAHRKIICACLAEGESIIDNIVLSQDIIATIEGMRQSGAKIRLDNNPLTNRYTLSIDTRNRKMEEKRIINCKESGSTLRFLTMIYASLGGETTFLGEGRLPLRPMEEAYRIFEQDKIEVIKGELNLPLTIKGNLKGGIYRIKADVSSQFLSGLLMALPMVPERNKVYIEGKFESKGYVDLTIDVMREFGVNVSEFDNGFLIDNQQYVPSSVIVEGDWSNCGYFYVMNMLGSNIIVNGLNLKTYQPDSIILKHLYEIQSNEHSVIDVSGCPDLAPALAVYAACAKGTTKLINAERLRKKESDRLDAISTNLQALRVPVREKQNEITIYGENKIKHGVINSYNDHRIAMAFSCLAPVVMDQIVIKNVECIDKSYPDFYKDMIKLGGDINEYKF
ncbi:MAG: 3-phosphoshikimate 1-carboxyvinyltransferase [Clostridia bacterium]|nr:3-phosphoshikimate 1-carboxyvinyltransferase [Clostridia bacterium]